MTTGMWHWLSSAVLVLGSLAAPPSAQATPITVNDPWHWLENRSTNTMGRTPGLRQVIGVGSAVPNGLAGTTAIASQGGFTTGLFYMGTTVAPNEFGATLAANSSRYGSWLLTFTNGPDSTQVLTPAIGAGLAPMPFVGDVLMNSTAASTSFSWSLPSAASFDAVRLNLYDRGSLNLPGNAPDLVFSRTVAPTSSFTLPPVLANGQPLINGKLYTMEISLLDYASNQVIAPQTDLRNRSRLHVDFVAGSTPGNGVYLPVVEPGVNGAPPIFHFNVGSVGSNLIYIDPEVAIGYRYQIGAGNPNFASVLLPTGIGDGAYRVVLDTGEEFGVTGGESFAFAAGGVSGFTVLGIEESAGLSPNNPTAFVTGLTFAGNGAFTGTMQAVLVPEAPTWATWVTGLLGLSAVLRWRARARQRVA